MNCTRRDFIKISAAGAALASSQFAADGHGMAAPAQSSRLETFSDWTKADRAARKGERVYVDVKEFGPVKVDGFSI